MPGSRKRCGRSPDAGLAERPPAAHGLVFLPFLGGERSLGWDASRRGRDPRPLVRHERGRHRPGRARRRLLPAGRRPRRARRRRVGRRHRRRAAREPRLGADPRRRPRPHARGVGGRRGLRPGCCDDRARAARPAGAARARGANASSRARTGTKSIWPRGQNTGRRCRRRAHDRDHRRRPRGGQARRGLPRRPAEKSAITIWSQDPHGPYHRPPLSKRLLRGESQPEDALVHPIDWYAENGVELRLGETRRLARRRAGRDGRDRHRLAAAPRSPGGRPPHAGRLARAAPPRRRGADRDGDRRRLHRLRGDGLADAARRAGDADRPRPDGLRAAGGAAALRGAPRHVPGARRRAAGSSATEIPRRRPRRRRHRRRAERRDRPRRRPRGAERRRRRRALSDRSAGRLRDRRRRRVLRPALPAPPADRALVERRLPRHDARPDPRRRGRALRHRLGVLLRGVREELQGVRRCGRARLDGAGGGLPRRFGRAAASARTAT